MTNNPQGLNRGFTVYRFCLYLYRFCYDWELHGNLVRNNTDSKLKIFAEIRKDLFSVAPHLNALDNYKVRNALSQFKLSAHNHTIETK